MVLYMFIKKLQRTLLGTQRTVVGHVPQLGLETVVGSLAVPDVTHDGEGFFRACHGEQLVVTAVDEQHGAGAGQRGDVRIVEPAAQSGKAVGESAVLPFLVGH